MGQGDSDVVGSLRLQQLFYSTGTNARRHGEGQLHLSCLYSAVQEVVSQAGTLRGFISGKASLRQKGRHLTESIPPFNNKQVLSSELQFIDASGDVKLSNQELAAWKASQAKRGERT